MRFSQFSSLWKMSAFTSLRRAVAIFVSIVLYGLAQGAMALAAEPAGPNDKKGSSGTWVTSYFIVLLVIGLGLMLVLKATGRKARARPAQFGE